MHTFDASKASKNMARFYAMSIEPTLFGEACLTRRWGRIGSGGKREVHHFPREEEAVARIQTETPVRPENDGLIGDRIRRPTSHRTRNEAGHRGIRRRRQSGPGHPR
ncbi:WGR domain-containing protein [Rhizobium lentis]|nr:WGR domain-containing protein [Rhizobium lentis]MBX5060974.1 WGR domain-containing protein [Rhizobium lentis]MBX5073038.1 WGR domain-containing protein [Rhizobium lentis]